MKRPVKVASPGLKQKNNDQEAVMENMQMLTKKILHEIYKQALSKRMSKAELASHMGVSASYLSQIFHGKKQLTLKSLHLLQNALNIEFDIKVVTAT